jgi:hypothetical protein
LGFASLGEGLIELLIFFCRKVWKKCPKKILAS